MIWYESGPSFRWSQLLSIVLSDKRESCRARRNTSEISAEVIKTDMKTAVNMLHSLFTKAVHMKRKRYQLSGETFFVKLWLLVKSYQLWNIDFVPFAAFTSLLFFEIQWNGPLRAKRVLILDTCRSPYNALSDGHENNGNDNFEVILSLTILMKQHM